jgi:hypothetical protein
MSERMPLTWVIPKQEIDRSKSLITEIKDWEKRFWAIGLNGDNLQPDNFLKFFLDRDLPFEFFVRNIKYSVNIGEESAYSQNIETLENYITKVRNTETEACESIISELKQYKERNWAIGLNGDTLQPDNFVKFFGDRKLPFVYYVSSKGINIGSPEAYEDNIKTLVNYIDTLSN